MCVEFPYSTVPMGYASHDHLALTPVLATAPAACWDICALAALVAAITGGPDIIDWPVWKPPAVDIESEPLGASLIETLNDLGNSSEAALTGLGCWNGLNAARGSVRSATIAAVIRVPLGLSVWRSSRGSRIA